MSKIALTPNASGTGTFTIASPNSNTNRTLTLPDADGALLTADGDGSGLTSLTAGNLTGALPAVDGSALTNLPAAYTALSKAQTGYITLTGGLIIQWGRSGSIAGGGGSTYDAFPIAFPNACFTAAMSITTSSFSNTWPWTIQISNSGVTFRAHGSIAAVSGNWIAIGH